ncbi:hypothetical protein Hanom_Chr11g00967841 [Helianthus anomalus]
MRIAYHRKRKEKNTMSTSFIQPNPTLPSSTVQFLQQTLPTFPVSHITTTNAIATF